MYAQAVSPVKNACLYHEYLICPERDGLTKKIASVAVPLVDDDAEALPGYSQHLDLHQRLLVLLDDGLVVRLAAARPSTISGAGFCYVHTHTHRTVCTKTQEEEKEYVHVQGRSNP